MDAREKAQRLALVTNIKFKLDSDGNMVESDAPIDQSLIDQAMNMSKVDYESGIESQRRDNIVAQLRTDYGIQASFLAYAQAGGELNSDDFIRLNVDIVEDAKLN